MIKERTSARLDAARSRGRVGGKKKALKAKQVKRLKTLSEDKTITIGEIYKQFSISKATYYNYIRDNKPNEG
ncbi:MAG: helix-turn-helix domain-containing protein [Candidatus Cloacimonetes bacterium]|jgi:DNA invertase Pin-like site-specific DNA recombinase|nr:helix-turn-helix domain-containing protein [Candidatus Cloacimonadota bacterium]